MMTPSGVHELNRMEKGASEALAVAPLIQAVAQRIGTEEALGIVREVHEQEALRRGLAQRARMGQTGIAELVEEVARRGEGGVWEMDVVEHTSGTYYPNVPRCPYCEKYRELGLEELGVALS